MKKLFYLFFAVFLFAGCDAILGKEIARVPVNEISADTAVAPKEVALPLKKEEKVVLWSDMDIEYEGDVQLLFQVEVLANGKSVELLEFDPREKNMTMNEVKTTMGNQTDWQFEGKNASYQAREDAEYTFRCRLVSSENSTLVVNKAEIVIRK